MVKELTIKRVDTGIERMCNCCGAANFKCTGAANFKCTMKPYSPYMFEIKIASQTTALCGDCFNELVMKALMFENEENNDGN